MAIQLGQAFIALHADGAALPAEIRAQVAAAMAEASGAMAAVGGDAAVSGAAGTTAAADEAAAALTRMGESGVAAGGQIAAGTAEADAALGRLVAAEEKSATTMKAVGESAVLAGDEVATAADRGVVATDRMAASSARAAKSTGLLGMSWKSVGEFAGGAAVYEAIKAAGNYQQQLTRLVTSANEAQGNIAMVSKGMLDMGTQVGFGALDLSKAMYVVESGGFHGAAGLLALKASAQIAKQENADLMTTTQAVTTTLHDYAYTGLTAADAASKLNEAVSFGKTNLQDFSSALHSVEPNAAAAHIKLEDVLGDLATMTNSGMTAQQAAQNLAHTLSNFEKPTQPMINALAQVGVRASDLTKNLGANGVSGTLQIVDKAIRDHMGPSGAIAVKALNDNKDAAASLVKMMETMPPGLAKLSQGLLDGSESIKKYRSAARDLGGQAGDMGTQFLSLYQSSDGFNSILKAGGPAVMQYLGYLAKSTGTVDALRTALLLTGNNAHYVNDAIAHVRDTSAQADGNVSKWTLTQQTFNQKFANAKAAVQNFGIEMGTKLLPLLSQTASFVASQVVPAAQKLVDWFGKLAASQGVAFLFGALKVIAGGLAIGLNLLSSAIGAVVGWFVKLPGPIQAAVMGLGALKLILATNMFGLFSSYGAKAAEAAAATGAASSAAAAGVGELAAAETAETAASAETTAASVGLRGAFADLAGGAVAAGTAMRAGMVSSLGEVTAAATAAKVATREAAAARFGMAEAQLPRAAGDVAALGGGLRNLATQGFGAAKSAGMGLVNMLGGPWMVGLAAAGVAVGALIQSSEHHKAAVDAEVASLQHLLDVQAQGGTAGQAAGSQVDAFKKRISDLQHQIDSAGAAAVGGGKRMDSYGASQQAAGDHVAELRSELAQAQAGLAAQTQALSPVERATNAVTTAQNELNRLYADPHATGAQLAVAGGVLRSARADLTRVTQGLNDAEKTHLQLLNDQADKSLSASDAAMAAAQAQMSLGSAIDQYNADAKSGSSSTGQLKSEMMGLASQAIDNAKQQAASAAATAAAKGVTDTSTISHLAELHALQAVAGQISGPGKQAILDRIKILQTATNTAALSTAAEQALGNSIVQIPGTKDIRINTPTADQEAQLKALGFTVTHMPDGTVVVHANTSDAQAALQRIVDTNWTAVVHTVTDTAGVHISGGFSASGTTLKNATGNIVHPYASGGFEPMSGGLGKIVGPNTWRVIGDRATSDEAYIPLDGSARSKALWLESGRRLGMGQGKGLSVTYAPQYQLPAQASAEQVGAIVSANLVRDLHLGLGDGSLGEAA